MTISQPLCEAFASFLLSVPAKRLKEDSMKLLQGYTRHNHQEVLPKPSDYFLVDLMALFDFLDIIDKEADQSGL